MMADATLALKGVADWKWEVGNLYRNISQAWDFTVAEGNLVNAGSRIVTGMIVVLNDKWRKEVICEYRVTSGLISSIAFSASKPVKIVTE